MKDKFIRFIGGMIFYSSVGYLFCSLLASSISMSDWEEWHVAVFIAFVVTCAAFTASRIYEKYI